MTDVTEKAEVVESKAQLPDVEHEPLESLQSEGLGGLFDELGVSLLISTYQAAKLIVVHREGEVVNTHYRTARKPMGIAVTSNQIAVGVAGEIVFYGNVPENCSKLKPADRHDACFVPRYRHITGEIDIHEMAFGSDGQPWFINTRFSALCTLSGMYSFVPVWKPPFVSAYAAEDRCHLNGLGMVDGKPRFVTALGEADVKGGWRENKAAGGVLIDLASGNTLCRGLSMPHSPRWYGGQLWVCESGKGNLSTVDLATGRLSVVCELPGFTRGLDFCGPYAFVGLSKVRETATFSGIPIAEPERERNCGVWIIDLRRREVVGALRFTSGVHEIFAVQALHGLRCPELLDQYSQLAMETHFLDAQTMQQVRSTKTA